MTKRIDVAALPSIVGTLYPPPYDEPCLTRERKRLGDIAGLTQYGVNFLRLPPGAWSSQRHWHTAEEEFVYVLSGELTLVTDDGEEIFRAGDCAAFPKNTPNGHHFINQSNAPATLLEIGTRPGNDVCHYPDIDLHIDEKISVYTHKDGTPYPEPMK